MNRQDWQRQEHNRNESTWQQGEGEHRRHSAHADDQFDQQRGWREQGQQQERGRQGWGQANEQFGNHQQGQQHMRGQGEGYGENRTNQQWIEPSGGFGSRQGRASSYGGPEAGRGFGRSSGYADDSGYGSYRGGQQAGNQQGWNDQGWNDHGQQQQPWQQQQGFQPQGQGQFGQQGHFGQQGQYGQQGQQGQFGQQQGSHGQFGQQQQGQGQQYGYGSATGQQFGGGAYGNAQQFGGQQQRQNWSDGNSRTQGYAGVGPKGYSRSDDRVREDLCDRLCDAWDVDASSIEVDVKDGVAKLSGKVWDRSMKHRAEDLAESIRGVNEVENEIKVSSSSRNDRDQSRSELGSEGLGSRSTSATGSSRTTTKPN